MRQTKTDIIPDEISQQVKKSNPALVWILSLYGTAIGAGTLFLPIEAGLNGIWPIVIMLCLAFPLTFFSHRALCRFVFSGSSSNNDITDVVEEYFGRHAGNLLTVLYFLSIYPILLMYSVAITNTIQSFLTNQLGLNSLPRSLLAFVIISTLMTIIRFGQTAIIKVMSILVYPFVAILLLISFYLIPHWNASIFHHIGQWHAGHHMGMTIWLMIPVMVFSFNHSPIISSFAISQKKQFGEKADDHCTHILKYSHLMMVLTVMFFVISCVLSLSPEDLMEAKQQNISILSYLANHFSTSAIAYIAPLIALVAISKSFLGHYLGVSEGLQGIYRRVVPQKFMQKNQGSQQLVTELFIIISCWICATLNPNILKMIETLCGPVIAIILFLMPMYAYSKVSSLQKYRHKVYDGFTLLIGLIAISAIFYSLWNNWLV